MGLVVGVHGAHGEGVGDVLELDKQPTAREVARTQRDGLAADFLEEGHQLVELLELARDVERRGRHRPDVGQQPPSLDAVEQLAVLIKRAEDYLLGVLVVQHGGADHARPSLVEARVLEGLGVHVVRARRAPRHIPLLLLHLGLRLRRRAHGRRDEQLLEAPRGLGGEDCLRLALGDGEGLGGQLWVEQLEHRAAEHLAALLVPRGGGVAVDVGEEVFVELVEQRVGALGHPELDRAEALLGRLERGQ
mmetsp:Transcript_54245/g.161062  ORF Transcript_54245/g.161062 Transcript_54245/m.161062 type:complete len:248 (+) Transcript_54245:1428-2171(+)